jgi:hypothetical protein
MRAIFPTVFLLCALAFASVAARKSPSSSPPHTYFLAVVRDDCFRPYFVTLDWLSLASWTDGTSKLRECIPDSISKGVGVGITGGAVLVNALQVHKVWHAGTGKGLNLASQYQGMWSNLLMSVWWVWEGAPITAYGECIIQALGPAALISLLWRFSPPAPLHALGVVAATLAILTLALVSKAGLEAWLAGGHVPFLPPLSQATLSLLVSLLANLSFWASRLGQIATTHAAGSDKAQSIATLGANALGSLARVFTGMKEIKAPPALKPYFVYILAFNTLLNWTMVGQWVFYNRLGGGKGGAGRSGGPSGLKKKEAARAALAKDGVSPPPARAAAKQAAKVLSPAADTKGIKGGKRGVSRSTSRGKKGQ